MNGRRGIPMLFFISFVAKRLIPLNDENRISFSSILGFQTYPKDFFFFFFNYPAFPPRILMPLPSKLALRAVCKSFAYICK